VSRCDHRLRYLRHDGPEHLLAFAPTRSGKGVGLVIPSLLAWSERRSPSMTSRVRTGAKTAGFRAKQGTSLFQVLPSGTEGEFAFNPLGEVRLFTLRDVSDAQNIANMIVRTGEDSPQERYWQDAAASIATGMILHVCYEAELGGRVACLADLAYVFTRRVRASANPGRATQLRARPWVRTWVAHADWASGL